MTHPTAALRGLTAQGFELDLSPEALGEPRRSDGIVADTEALRARMSEDGYLYLPGFFDVGSVLEAQKSITDRLHAAGFTDRTHAPDHAVARSDSDGPRRPHLSHDNPTLHRLLYDGALIDFYQRLLGGPIRHYDFTWMRTVAPGHGTPPHADVVFMGRGTHNLCTAWVPLGDIDYDIGGLMLLEGSHRQPDIRDDYGTRDVDTYCSNVAGEQEYAREHGWRWDGRISDNPVELRKRIGGRWLTTEFRAGDLLTFSIYLVHASLDNRSSRLRLSSDSRYQLASEPVDERWIGAAPVGHGPDGKRGLIC